MSGPHDAAARWREALGAMTIPSAILADAPTSPHGFDPSRFADGAERSLDEPDSPARAAARAALPDGGSLLDVGCGAGAASLALVPPAGRIVGVDAQADMLAELTRRAEARGARVVAVQGRWPDVADRTPPADVAVCRHVIYNVPALPGFAAALTEHARRRVVVQLTAHHPLAWLGPAWRALHGWQRPPGPTADDALAVLEELDLTVHVARWVEPTPFAEADCDAQVAFARRHLCVGAERDADIVAVLRAHPPPPQREVVGIWWAGTAS